MQTFLPYTSYSKSAECLDRLRLGKQRVEVKQIYNALTHGGGWRNHPAVRMWRGHEYGLLVYGIIVCQEWRRRGYNDTLMEQFIEAAQGHPDQALKPGWLPDVTQSHQSNLVRKDPDHYRPWFPDVPDNLPYVWPVQ